MKKVPEFISLDEFEKIVAEEIAKYDLKDDGYHCKYCKAKIEYVIGALSIHYKEFNGCSGYGLTQQFDMPYCPTCEEPPDYMDRRGCIHISFPFRFTISRCRH